MTRDSQLWWLLMAGAILTTFSAHFDLLALCCDLTDKTKALIELGSLVVATLAGVMKASPLPISDEGRAKYLSDVVRR